MAECPPRVAITGEASPVLSGARAALCTALWPQASPPCQPRPGDGILRAGRGHPGSRLRAGRPGCRWQSRKWFRGCRGRQAGLRAGILGLAIPPSPVVQHQPRPRPQPLPRAELRPPCVPVSWLKAHDTGWSFPEHLPEPLAFPGPGLAKVWWPCCPCGALLSTPPFPAGARASQSAGFV